MSRSLSLAMSLSRISRSTAGFALCLLSLAVPAWSAGPPAAPQPKRAEPKPAQAPPAAAAAAQDKPAEEVFKNIKVLNGMPSSQMFQIMHLMRSALGVQCDFCHVTEGNRFDLDTKKEKESARAMVRMMQAINKNNFEGNIEVTCTTCHRGQVRPVAVPPIGGAVAESARRAPAGETAGEKQEALPAAAQIVDHYLDALGGEAAVAAVTHRVSRGTVLRAKVVDAGTPKARLVNRGQEDPLEIVQQAPDKLVATVGPPAARSVATFAGGAGTVESPEGRRPMTPQELRHMADEADLHWAVKLKQKADKMRVTGKDQIDGHDVYVVRAATDDKRRMTLFFDAQSGLLRRRLLLNPTVLGADPEQTDYDDYRSVGGVKVPFTITTSYLDDNRLGSTRKLTEVK